MNHARNDFLHLAAMGLRAGYPADVAVAAADSVIAEAEKRYGKEEPEPSIQDQILGFVAKAMNDPFIAKVFEGIPLQKTPEGETDYGGNGEPPPAPAPQPSTASRSMPRWK